MQSEIMKAPLVEVLDSVGGHEYHPCRCNAEEEPGGLQLATTARVLQLTPGSISHLSTSQA